MANRSTHLLQKRPWCVRCAPLLRKWVTAIRADWWSCRSTETQAPYFLVGGKKKTRGPEDAGASKHRSIDREGERCASEILQTPPSLTESQMGRRKLLLLWIIASEGMLRGGVYNHVFTWYTRWRNAQSEKEKDDVQTEHYNLWCVSCLTAKSNVTAHHRSAASPTTSHL